MGISILSKLKDELHFTRNLCEHSSSPGVCASLYCVKIHDLQNHGKEIFNSDSFPLTLFMAQHEYNYFSPLEEARRNCCKNCELSRFYFRIAEMYVKTLERSV